jgi:hypothetical protein
MLALIVLALFVLSPIVLLAIGLKTAAILMVIYVVLSLPSVGQVVVSSIKTRTLPRIIGGPNSHLNSPRQPLL